MLTICTRCRSPFDRRSADTSLPAALSTRCARCSTGADLGTPPALATVSHLDTGVTVLPRGILQAAS